MTAISIDTDPYAELDFRADAAELSDGLRKPMAVNRGRANKRSGFPMPQHSAVRIGRLR